MNKKNTFSRMLLDLPLAKTFLSAVEADVYLATMGIRTLDADLIRRALAVRSLSRSNLGWVTRHRTRLWEYPWTLRQVDLRLKERSKSAVDVGAGRSPVPIALSRMGLRTLVADPGNDASSGEWDWTDYTRFDIETRRSGMEALGVSPESLGFLVSVSVIEHVPAKIRRAGLAEFARVLEPGGVCVITVDLVPGTDRIWNRALGIQVEADDEHGSLPDLIAEASHLGLENEAMERCPLAGRRPHVDVMGLVFRKSATP
jgi:SAM-dependent methyltransferase